MLASAAQDYMIRVWRFARRQEDTGRKIESVLDLPLDKDIQMRENTFSFTCSGKIIGIHHEYSCRIYGYLTQGIRNVLQV